MKDAHNFTVFEPLKDSSSGGTTAVSGAPFDFSAGGSRAFLICLPSSFGLIGFGMVRSNAQL